MDIAVWVTSLITAGLSIGLSTVAILLSRTTWSALTRIEVVSGVIQENTGRSHQKLLDAVTNRNWAPDLPDLPSIPDRTE